MILNYFFNILNFNSLIISNIPYFDTFNPDFDTFLLQPFVFCVSIYLTQTASDGLR